MKAIWKVCKSTESEFAQAKGIVKLGKTSQRNEVYAAHTPRQFVTFELLKNTNHF